MKIVLDSMIFDLIVATDGLSNRIARSVEKGQIKILTTHVQEDQLTAMPGLQKLSKIAEVPREMIPTSVFFLDLSRLGMARLGDRDDRSIDQIRRGNIEHTPDALIADTAQKYADVLVTEDATLAKRVRAEGFSVKVWSFKKLIEFVDSLV